MVLTYLYQFVFLNLRSFAQTTVKLGLSTKIHNVHFFILFFFTFFLVKLSFIVIFVFNF